MYLPAPPPVSISPRRAAARTDLAALRSPASLSVTFFKTKIVN
jgi:hypothetical protein